MERQANSRSVFSRTRFDGGYSQSLTRKPNDQLNDRDFDMSPRMKPTQRFNLSPLNRSNTLSVIETSRKVLVQKQLGPSDGFEAELAANVKFINDNELPECFDVDKIKKKWVDSK